VHRFPFLLHQTTAQLSKLITIARLCQLVRASACESYVALSTTPWSCS
jgi:hypothetical protein